MTKITETRIGALGSSPNSPVPSEPTISSPTPASSAGPSTSNTGALSATTFRATEAQKAVLMNIDSMITSGRNVTQQDALNIPQEELDKNDLDRAQLESAYDTLVHLQLLRVKPDETIEISPAGQKVTDEAKQQQQTEPESEPTGEPQEPMGQGDQQGMPPQGGMNQQPNPQAPGSNNPMESLKLIRYLNDYSKFLID